MQKLIPSPLFSKSMNPVQAKSLSLQFLLNEWIYGAELLHDLEIITPIRVNKSDLTSIFSSLSKELDKLCFYCEILLQTSSMSGEKIAAILQEMTRTVGSVKFEILLTKTTGLSAWAAFLSRKFVDFFKALSPFFYDVRLDENILVSLIENKNRLNAFLGERHIEELLALLFPQGPFALRKVIEEGYAQRGFSSFFSSVEPLIDKIEWEPACNFLQR